MSMPEADAQLPLKKRARRRLVGAIALAVLAAVVLPMVMDQSPQLPVQDVQIRIPGQDQVPAYQPKALAAKGQEAPAAKVAPEKPAAVAPADKAAEKPAEKLVEKAADPVAEKGAAKPEKKPVEKAPEKAPPASEKDAKATARNGDDAQRAAALLAGKPAEVSAKPAAAGGEHVILIGAFANPANVKQLQSKLGELNIKVYTETLDSPQGQKTRVRAGPFPSREAAEKALEKMKRIGINGIVAAKQ